MPHPRPLHWRLYDQALPITEALESFAPPQVKEQLNLLDFGNALVRHPDFFWTRQRARFHNIASLLSALLPAPLQFNAGGDGLRRQQRARLYDIELAYIHGLPRYVLLGFVRPRAVDASPVAIPLDCWDGDVDWDCDTLQAGSLVFEGLRIANLVTAPPALTTEWLDGSAPIASPPPVTPENAKAAAAKPGRKSAQGPVCEAVDTFYPNSDFRKAPRKRQLEMVLQLLRGRDPALDALLEKAVPKTLEGHIARRLKALEGSGELGGSIP